MEVGGREMHHLLEVYTCHLLVYQGDAPDTEVAHNVLMFLFYEAKADDKRELLSVERNWGCLFFW